MSKQLTIDGDPLLGLSQRVPPNHVQAEQALLGAILANNKAFDAVVEFLRPEHFADPIHGKIYEAIARNIANGRLADPVTLRAHFLNMNVLDEVGGAAYLAQLLSAMVGMVNAGDYGRIIYDAWMRRMIIDAGEQMINASFGGQLTGPEIVASGVAALEETILRADARRSNSFDANLDMALEQIQQAIDRKGPAGIGVGMSDVDRVLGGLEDGTLNILAGRPGMGKEQPVATPVLTPQGWRMIGALRPGDHVITASGRPTLVTAVFPQGQKQAYRVTFRDGSSTECGLEHLWQVYSCEGKHRDLQRTMSLKQIIENGVTRNRKDGRYGAKWHIPVMAAAQFPDAKLPIDPYFLGVLIGDGSMVGKSLRFSTPDFDRDIVARMISRLPVDTHLRETRSSSCPYFEISGPGRRAFRAVIAGIGLDVHSGRKFIPPEYFIASAAQRMELLRGLMDTDGSATNQGSTIFYTTSERLSADVCALARSLGAVAWVRVYNRSKSGKTTEYCVNIKIDDCPFHTERKKSRWVPQRPTRYIYRIEPTQVCEQVCIMVEDPSHLYVTNDYIVTHNTALAMGWFLHIARHVGPVMLFSLEMSGTALARRALASAAGISVEAMRLGNLTATDIRALAAARSYLAGLPLFIEDAAGMTPTQIALRARMVKRKRGIRLVGLDHLHIVKSERDEIKHGPTYAVGQTSLAMQRMAKDLNLPVLALCQLNRGVEARDDKRPGMADLKQSGDIEQNADTISFIYRPEYYMKKAPPVTGDVQKDSKAQEKHDQCKRDAAGKAELIFEKLRDGNPQTVELMFDGAQTKFYQVDHHQQGVIGYDPDHGR